MTDPFLQYFAIFLVILSPFIAILVFEKIFIGILQLLILNQRAESSSDKEYFDKGKLSYKLKLNLRLFGGLYIIWTGITSLVINILDLLAINREYLALSPRLDKPTPTPTLALTDIIVKPFTQAPSLRSFPNTQDIISSLDLIHNPLFRLLLPLPFILFHYLIRSLIIKQESNAVSNSMTPVDGVEPGITESDTGNI